MEEEVGEIRQQVGNQARDGARWMREDAGRCWRDASGRHCTPCMSDSITSHGQQPAISILSILTNPLTPTHYQQQREMSLSISDSRHSQPHRIRRNTDSSNCGFHKVEPHITHINSIFCITLIAQEAEINQIPGCDTETVENTVLVSGGGENTPCATGLKNMTKKGP